MEGSSDRGTGICVLDGVAVSLKEKLPSLRILLDTDLLLDKKMAVVARVPFIISS